MPKAGGEPSLYLTRSSIQVNTDERELHSRYRLGP